MWEDGDPVPLRSGEPYMLKGSTGYILKGRMGATREMLASDGSLSTGSDGFMSSSPGAGECCGDMWFVNLSMGGSRSRGLEVGGMPRPVFRSGSP